jgi:hypothetical protein
MLFTNPDPDTLVRKRARQKSSIQKPWHCFCRVHSEDIRENMHQVDSTITSMKKKGHGKGLDSRFKLRFFEPRTHPRISNRENLRRYSPSMRQDISPKQKNPSSDNNYEYILHIIQKRLPLSVTSLSLYIEETICPERTWCLDRDTSCSDVVFTRLTYMNI